MPIRKFLAKPIKLGPYSRGIVLPAWWLRVNGEPAEFELDITMDRIEIRPGEKEDAGDETRQAIRKATNTRQ